MIPRDFPFLVGSCVSGNGKETKFDPENNDGCSKLPKEISRAF